MPIRIIYGNRAAADSERLLDAALAYAVRCVLKASLASPHAEWGEVPLDGAVVAAVPFGPTDLVGGTQARVWGEARLKDGILKGFDLRWDGQEAGAARFTLAPMAELAVMAEAQAADDGQAEVATVLGCADGQSGGLRFNPLNSPFEDVPYDAFDVPQDVFGFPYEFETPGQLDFCLGSAAACMERTIVERMDCQDEFVDRIALPDGLLPGARAVYLKTGQDDDTLYVETDGGETRFVQMPTDAAATVTKYVMQNYEKKPLLCR